MSVETTGKNTADALIKSGTCVLHGAFVTSDGVADATLKIYDNTGAAGKVVREFVVPATQRYGGFFYKEGLKIHTGIYCDITGANAAYWIDWKQE